MNNNNKTLLPPKTNQAHFLPKEQNGEEKKASVTPVSEVTDNISSYTLMDVMTAD
jgi:hypothetical protein